MKTEAVKLKRINLTKNGKFQNPSGRIIMPGDPDYNVTRTNQEWISNLLGIPKQQNQNFEIAGYVLVDKRQNPPVMIFKNCRFSMGAGQKLLKVKPQPFEYLGEVLHIKEQMHLSMADSEKVRPTALCRDPGLGKPKPDFIRIDQKEARQR